MGKRFKFKSEEQKQYFENIVGVVYQNTIEPARFVRTGSSIVTLNINGQDVKFWYSDNFDNKDEPYKIFSLKVFGRTGYNNENCQKYKKTIIGSKHYFNTYLKVISSSEKEFFNNGSLAMKSLEPCDIGDGFKIKDKIVVLSSKIEDKEVLSNLVFENCSIYQIKNFELNSCTFENCDFVSEDCFVGCDFKTCYAQYCTGSLYFSGCDGDLIINHFAGKCIIAVENKDTFSLELKDSKIESMLNVRDCLLYCYGNVIEAANVEVKNFTCKLSKIKQARFLISDDLEISGSEIEYLNIKNSCWPWIVASKIQELKTHFPEKCIKHSFFDHADIKNIVVEKRINDSVDQQVWKSALCYRKSNVKKGYTECKVLVELSIPSDAYRTYRDAYSKNRASHAVVKNFYKIDRGGLTLTKFTDEDFENLSVRSDYDISFEYKIGDTIKPKNTEFDLNLANICAPGIHFFYDMKAAVKYLL